MKLFVVSRRVARIVLGVFVGFIPPALWAEGLQVTPILLDFNPQQRALAVWISNTGKRPISAQARVQAWRQGEAGDTLEPTTELVASPPMVQIPPGQTQVVRVVRMRTTGLFSEMAYRLLVDELPSAEPVAANVERASQGIQFLFRYSIPVFVGASDSVLARDVPTSELVESSVKAHLTLGDGQSINVAVSNTSARRVKLSDFALVAPSGERKVLGPGLFGYVLSGQTRKWSLAAPRGIELANTTLHARINEDSNETVLPQDPR